MKEASTDDEHHASQTPAIELTEFLPTRVAATVEYASPVADFTARTNSPVEQQGEQDSSERAGTEENFLSVVQQSVRLPGPSLPEAVGWMVLMLGSHLVAAIVAGIAAFIYHVAMTGNADPKTFSGEIGTTNFLIMMAGEGLISTLLIMLLATVRLLPNPLRTLNLNLPRWDHLCLVVVVTPAMATLAGQLYFSLHAVWTQLADAIPALKVFDQLNAMTQVTEIAANTPFLWLVVLIAICPAIAEELVFRGVIGRGLIARWGLVWGIALSSMMFAALHLHPAHALAVLPLGVMLHYAYWTTRSFWTPVWWHFCNNGFAVLAMTMLSEGSTPQEQLDTPVPLAQLAAALVAVAMAVCYFWQTRVREVNSTGQPRQTDFPTISAPPPAQGYQRVCGTPSIVVALGTIACLLLFFVVAAITNPAPPGEESKPGTVSAPAGG